MMPVKAAADDPTTLREFAEMIAEDIPIPDAAKALGFSHATGKRLMRRLKQEMGEA